LQSNRIATALLFNETNLLGAWILNTEQLTAFGTILTWVTLLILGACFGSFATVLESRVTDGKSIVSPGSQCPNCHRELRWNENIPILGYFLLRGKCKGCGLKISSKYPLIEITTAILFLSAFTPGPAAQLGMPHLATAAIAIVTVPLFLIDIKLYRLPNLLTYSAAIAATIFALSQAFITGDWGMFLTSMLCGVVPAALLFLIAVFSKNGMGLGDVKLVVSLGIAAGMFGPRAAIATFVVAFLIGGLYSLGVLITKKGNSKSAIPFGPFLLAGFWICFLGGDFLQNIVLSPWSF
jgi:leader peptidase (prepilin peptidase)/N-methyltransferase